MPGMAVAEDVEPHSLRKLYQKSLKRTYELFLSNRGERPAPDLLSIQARISAKINDEYAAIKDKPPPVPSKETAAAAPPHAADIRRPAGGAAETAVPSTSGAKPPPIAGAVAGPGNELVIHQAAAPDVLKAPGNMALSTLGSKDQFSAQVLKRLPSKWPKPVWHPPWKLYRVISGHLGWVRSVAFEPGNEWFVTGSADRTIKVWDTASGQLKLTLTGHIEQVRGLAVSSRHPYMFSAGDDKQVKCWDLEYNKVIRSYHGHLSGVYCLALHPTLDILMTGGRDSACRVWDMRTKAQIFCLSGHENTVCAVLTQPTDPQIITGSHDSTVKLWDLAAGKTMSTLTFHKKSVRALAMHPFEHTFASASADNIKKFKLPQGEFLHNMLTQQKTIVNCMAVNEDGVLATGGDNGSMWYWDWKSGHNFQQDQSIVQPGSLDSEAGIFAMTYDVTGSRLVTCEADKTIKMWKEDEDATPETHPGLPFRPPKDIKRF